MKKCLPHFVLLTVCLLPLVAAGQQTEEPPSGEIEDAQILIEKDKPLTLPRANRFYQKTDIRPVSVDTVALDYRITQPGYQLSSYRTTFTTKPFQPGEGLQDLQNYIKAGYGNYNSPLVEGFAGVTRENAHAGLWLKHESFGKGPVRGKESAYGLTELILTGALATEKVEFSPEIYYQREGYYLFGYDKEAYLSSLAPGESALDLNRKVGASHLYLDAAITAVGSEKLRASLKPFVGISRMKIKGEETFNSEVNPGVEGEFSFLLNERLSTGVNTGFSYYNYESGLTSERNVFHVNPWVSVKSGRLFVRAGLDVYTGSDSLRPEGDQYLYPDLEAKFGLTEALGIFARVKGILRPVSLNDLRLANRYLEDSLLLLNENNRLNAQAGIRSALSDKLLIEAFVQYSQTRNKALFVHSPTDSSRFAIIYDTGNFNEAGIGFSAKYLAGVATSITAGMTFLTYKTDQVQEAWYLPRARFELLARHTISEKLKLEMDLGVLQGITAPAPADGQPVKLDPIADLGLGAQYDFIPAASAFLRFQNLLSQNYERYMYYPSRGLMMKLGFIYRF